MKYTKSQLDSKTKTSLVDLVTKLQNTVEDLSTGPLTADAIKSANLKLKGKALEVKANREKRAAEKEEAIARITAEKEQKIKELELKYSSTESKDAEELNSLFDDLQARAEKTTEDLSFGLEVAENEANIKLAEIKEKVETEEANSEKTLSELKSKIETAHENTKEEIKRISIEHARTVEQKEYDQKIALRDLDMKFIEASAEQLNQKLIDVDKYEELTEYKSKSEDEIAERIATAVESEVSKIKSTEAIKYNQLKSSNDKDIALLENTNEHLRSSLESAETRNSSLEAQVAKIPTMIAEAVAAAKADVTVHQDANKK